jgi:glycosyltransferase involved in cell wall biosynthesis
MSPTKILLKNLDKADVVFVEGPWQVSAIESLLDDGLLIYSSHNYEPERFATLQDGSLFHRYLLNKVVSVEQEAVESADIVVCTSDRDREIYQKRTDPADILVAPNGTHTDSLTEVKGENTVRDQLGLKEHDTIVLFIGSKHTPNIRALESLHEIATLVDNKAIQFVAVGTACNEVDIDTVNVQQIGFVEEIEPYLEAADFAIHPMTSGGGTNVKLLDYFKWALPVISTPFGVRGLNVTDNTDVIISKIDGFPDSIEQLHQDQELRKELGQSAQNVVRECYDWNQISADLRSEVVSRVQCM